MGRKPPANPPDDPTSESTESSEPEAPATPGLPSFQEVADALGRAPDDALLELYTAEAAAQRSVCFTDPWSDALSAALVRRVEVATELGPRLGSTDPQVRALEEPHTKRVPAPSVIHSEKE